MSGRRARARARGDCGLKDGAAETLGNSPRGSTQAQTAGLRSKVRLVGLTEVEEAGDGGTGGMPRREAGIWAGKSEEGRGNLGQEGRGGRRESGPYRERGRKQEPKQKKEPGARAEERRGGNREPGRGAP